MAPIMKDWRVELIQAHPTLFHPPADAPGPAQGYPSCEGGWHGLLERLCVRIEAALAEDETIQVVQIKEKFGTLRFYWRGRLSDETKAKVQEAVELAEARSACTCELCGAEGRLYRHGGTLMTRCEAHAKGQPVTIKPGFENVHFVQRFVAGQPSVTYRRYDRATDTFADIPPPEALDE